MIIAQLAYPTQPNLARVGVWRNDNSCSMLNETWAWIINNRTRQHLWGKVNTLGMQAHYISRQMQLAAGSKSHTWWWIINLTTPPALFRLPIMPKLLILNETPKTRLTNQASLLASAIILCNYSLFLSTQTHHPCVCAASGRNGDRWCICSDGPYGFATVVGCGGDLLENPVKITPTRWATRAARGRARKGFNALDASGLHVAVDAARVNAHADQWARKWHVCAKCSSWHFRPITMMPRTILFSYPMHHHLLTHGCRARFPPLWACQDVFGRRRKVSLV